MTATMSFKQRVRRAPARQGPARVPRNYLANPEIDRALKAHFHYQIVGPACERWAEFCVVVGTPGTGDTVNSTSMLRTMEQMYEAAREFGRYT